MRLRLKSPGVTLVELLVGISIFGILMSLLAVAITSSRKIWERAASGSSSQNELRKSFAPLAADLERSEFQTVRVAGGPLSLMGKDGDAVWFLSAVDPASGEVVRTPDGRPLWQRNILYYSVVPNQHHALYGFDCTGFSDAKGFEIHCPHKILVRKVIDNPPATGPGDPPEEIIANIGPYLTRPSGLKPSTAPQTGLEDVSFKSRGLVSFRAELQPNADWPGEVRIEVSAASTEEARRVVTIGQASLDQFLSVFTFSVFPPVSQATP